MLRTYKIHPRPADLGGGWNLKLYEDDQEAGSGVYLAREEDSHVGGEWWNGLPDTQQWHWLMMAASSMPAAARNAYLLAEAYNDAMDEGESWAA
jgi:hypothetical protein